MALGQIAVLKTLMDISRDGLRADLLTIVGDSAYPAGGTPTFQDKLSYVLGGAPTVHGFFKQDGNANTMWYDRTNDTLRVSTPAGVDVATNTNLSSQTYMVLVLSM